MTKEEAIRAMKNGKQVTSDDFISPDEEYCIYDNSYLLPFRFIVNDTNKPLNKCWNSDEWRIRRVNIW